MIIFNGQKVGIELINELTEKIMIFLNLILFSGWPGNRVICEKLFGYCDQE